MNLVNLIAPHDQLNVREFIEVANHRQSRFRFVSKVRWSTRNLIITDAPLDALYLLEPGKGVSVSAWQSGHAAHCIGLSSEEFLLLSSLLGLIQLRCLELNPILIAEDLLHSTSRTCLYCLKESRAQFLLYSEVPRLCRPCQEFYRCMGLELEIGEFLGFLDLISRTAF